VKIPSSYKSLRETEAASINQTSNGLSSNGLSLKSKMSSDKYLDKKSSPGKEILISDPID